MSILITYLIIATEDKIELGRIALRGLMDDKISRPGMVCNSRPITIVLNGKGEPEKVGLADEDGKVYAWTSGLDKVMKNVVSNAIPSFITFEAHRMIFPLTSKTLTLPW